MKIKDLMIQDVVFASPDTGISEVANLIFSNRFHGLPVINRKKEVVGIITEDDFFLKNYSDLFLPSYIRFLQENKNAQNLPEDMKRKIEKLSSIKASDIMSENCLTVTPETQADKMMEIIKETKFTTFPVVDENKKLAGIITLSDILGIVKKGTREMSQSLNNKKRKKLYKLASELDALWQNKIVFISKKKVKTWKGGLFIIISALILIAFFHTLFLRKDNDPVCNLENLNSLPIECQKFTYSEWGYCRENGTQSREIISRSPANCEGGRPVLIQKCQ